MNQAEYIQLRKFLASFEEIEFNSDSDADNLYITITARSLNSKAKIITRAGRQRYANAIRNSGADEVIIPEYEGGLMTGRLIQKYYPDPGSLE